MTDWRAFAGLSAVVVLLLLALTRASQRALSAEPGAADGAPGPAADGADGAPDDPHPDRTDGRWLREDARRASRPGATLSQFGPWSLLANVLLTHGLFAGIVAAAAGFWQVPPGALGIGVPTPAALGWGVVAGVALYVADELGAAGAALLGVDHEERLRELLAPESAVGWAVLLGGVLPTVAIAEELVFRGALVGALATGFAISPWALAAASSVAFGLAHGVQGRGGVLVTGLLGFALAAAFVVTGSLLLVVVAHYVVNALEFVVHEGLGVEWV